MRSTYLKKSPISSAISKSFLGPVRAYDALGAPPLYRLAQLAFTRRFQLRWRIGKIREDVFLLCLREIRRVDNLRDRGKDRFETESDRRPLLIARREGLDYAEPTYRLPL